MGIGKKSLQLERPTQLTFETNQKEEHKIARVSASGYNSAAFNEDDNMWIWGGTGRGKLGLNSTVRDQLDPIFT